MPVIFFGKTRNCRTEWDQTSSVCPNEILDVYLLKYLMSIHSHNVTLKNPTQIDPLSDTYRILWSNLKDH